MPISLSNTGTLTVNAGPAFGGTIDEIFLNGGSVAINGTSGDYLVIPNTSSKLDATGDFTFETFIYWVSMPATGSNNIFGNSGVASTYQLYAISVAANTWKFKISVVGYGDVLTGDTILYAGQWYHLAHTRTGGINRLFVNGVLQSSTYSDATSRPYGSNSAFVGQNSNCFISNLRFVRGTSLYTQTFNPPAAPLNAYSTNTSVLLNTNFWDSYRDSGSSSTFITSAGTTSPSSLTPFNNRSWSGYFNSTTDYITYTDNNNFGTSDFTVEFWYYAFIDTLNLIMASASTNNWNILTYAGQLYWQENGSNLGGVGYGSPPTNQWVHIAASRTGGFLNLYINGARVLNASNSYNYSGTGLGRSFGNSSGGTQGATLMSNVRFIKGRGIYSGASITPPTAPLTASTDTTLLTLQNSTFKDNSLYSNAFTLTGSPTITSSNPFASNVSTLGTFSGSYSVYLNGSSYLQTSTFDATFTGNFTFECWAYVIAYGGTSSFFTIGNETSGRYYFALTASGGQLWSNQYGGADFTWGTSTSVPLNAWTHVAWVRVGTTVTAYVNGGAVGTQTISGTVGNVGPVTIGATPDGSNLRTGYMSNVRLVRAALYTSTFTPSTVPLVASAVTTLLTLQNSKFKDNSFNNNSFALTGTPTLVHSNPFSSTTSTLGTLSGSSSIVQRITSSTLQVSSGIDEVFLSSNSVKFNGTTDYLSLSTNSGVFNFGTGDFTIETWIYPTRLSGYQQLAGATNSANGAGLYLQGSTVLVYATGNVAATPSSSVVLSVWQHIAAVRVSGVLNIYINGVLQGTQAFTNNLTTNNGVIGANTSGSSEFYQGYISNLRVVKSAVYTGAFTPPAAPPLPATNLSFLLNVQTSTNRISDATSYNNSITRVGTPAVSTTGPFPNVAHRLNKTGSIQVSSYFNELPPTGSISFNGTTDYLTFPSNAALAFGAGDFTVECWIYLNAVPSGSPEIFNAGDFHLNFRSSANIAITNNGSVLSNLSNTISTGVWTHVAAVRASGNMTIYLNGVANTVATGQTYSFVQGTGQIGTGNGASGPFLNAYISNLRVLNGTALYTGNFLVPTAPLSLPAVGYTSLLLSTPYIPPTTSTSAFVDYSINPNVITKNGSPTSIAANPFKI